MKKQAFLCVCRKRTVFVFPKSKESGTINIECMNTKCHTFCNRLPKQNKFLKTALLDIQSQLISKYRT